MRDALIEKADRVDRFRDLPDLVGLAGKRLRRYYEDALRADAFGFLDCGLGRGLAEYDSLER
ncbi:MAG: hypothetical protein ACT4P3_16035 [Betaproteobacteria bacterium]